MKKIARNIISLSLVLVLVCTLAATTFAYDDILCSTEVEYDLDVNRYNSSAYMMFSTADYLQSASISVSYDVYYVRNDNPALPGNHSTLSGYAEVFDRDVVHTSKTLDSSTYYGFAYATATFRANLKENKATIEYHPDPITVYSGLFS